MQRYVLLLRGVNVGTKNSLPMADLRAMLESLGCRDVVTVIQSGNAVFEATRPPDDLTPAVEQALARRMGRPIATTLRTGPQLRAIVKRNPFAALEADPAKLCVTFLSKRPPKAVVAALAAPGFEPERAHPSGTEIYSWHPEGLGRSVLAVAIGKLPLEGAVTTRNWNTVLKLLALTDA